MSIEDTSKRDPLQHLACALENSDRYITDMESAGQRQLVNSTSLPTEGSDGLGELGFTLGPVDANDPLFVEVTLPDGWRKEGSDHDMWSYVVDSLGRRRVSVFYKAAFYDRRAFCRVDTPSSYAHRLVDGTSRMILDAEWATADVMREAFERIRDNSSDMAQRGNDEDGFYTKQIERCDELLAELDAS